MIQSMTAFVRGSSSSREGDWLVEIRCLNHRYFEFSLKTSPYLYPLEARIKDFVQDFIRRGKVSISITKNYNEEIVQRVKLDDGMVSMYLSAVDKLKKRFKVSGEINVQDLLGLPHILSFEHLKEDDPEKCWFQLQKILKRALASVVRIKRIEGKKLMQDILKRLDTIEKAMTNIEAHTRGNVERYFQKLKERADQLLSERAKGNDKDWIYREVAFLADRSDVTEEIVRMKSHLGLFRERMCADSDVGRELDFLCQEMSREINTLGAKAQHFEISRQTVLVKGEIEKIREQVQNIE
ncbi:MAG: YicC family protein [Candidatus Omnitrophica bacterium]|nr:YicC family protein [Candidatus Omnitrophota bacterium]